VDNQTTEATPQQGISLPGVADTTGVEFSDDLLADLVGKPAPTEPADQDGSPPVTPTLNDQWTARGGDLEDLYKGTVDLSGDMGTATIQELKDDATAYRKGQAQRVELTDEQAEFGNEKLRHMQELQAIVAAIPTEHVSEELKAAGAAFVERQQEQQDRILLAAVPRWGDQAVKATDRTAMRALTAEYGLPGQFIDMPMMAGVTKLIHDFTQLRLRIDGIKGKQKSPTSKGSKATASVTSTQADGVNSAINAGDKLGAIAKLLGG